ncbi:MAG: 2'-5' RNA ligase family protein [Ginsengibacter sp.]
MNTKTIKQIPGYNYIEYKIVLRPNEDLASKIAEIKKTFSEQYKTSFSNNFSIDIPLVNFVQLEMKEKQVLNNLQTIAEHYRPFKVNLKNFGSMPTHSIFINIESKQQVLNLVKELKSTQRWMHLDKENKAHFINSPFITIASKLLPWQFEKGWLEYKNHYFTGSFMAEEMLLMKRKIGTFKFHVVKQFKFNDIEKYTSQTELFF